MSKDRRRRTAWFPRSINPVHPGTYECAVMLTSSAPLFLWELPWDGKGFLVPCPMVVKKWRGLVKRPDGSSAPEAQVKRSSDADESPENL